MVCVDITLFEWDKKRSKLKKKHRMNKLKDAWKWSIERHIHSTLWDFVPSNFCWTKAAKEQLSKNWKMNFNYLSCWQQRHKVTALRARERVTPKEKMHDKKKTNPKCLRSLKRRGRLCFSYNATMEIDIQSGYTLKNLNMNSIAACKASETSNCIRYKGS